MKRRLNSKFVIIIFGPTAVGKSAFAEKLAEDLQQAQIVNCDLGQFYTDLSIGVAKPDYKSSKIKQHLFDIIDNPENFTVSHYRELVFNKIDQIWQENDIPILVGGSGFYLKSLFFPPLVDIENIENNGIKNIKKDCGEIIDKDLWDFLNKIDQERAKQINKNDIYRVKRAIDLWYKTGCKPSELAPEFSFKSNFLFVFLNKDRSELYRQIDLRTNLMIKSGWIDEVENLVSKKNGKENYKNWEDFLKNKKLIGYDLIIDFIINNLKNGQENKKNYNQDLDLLIQQIKQKTRNYAKRQITFWRSLEKQLKKEVEKNKYTNKVETEQVKNVSVVTCTVESMIEEFNLTINKDEKLAIDLYIKHLLAYLEPLFE